MIQLYIKFSLKKNLLIKLKIPNLKIILCIKFIYNLMKDVLIIDNLLKNMILVD